MGKTLSIIQDEKYLYLKYSPVNGIQWILDAFSKNDNLYIHKVFFVTKDMIINELSLGKQSVSFLFARKVIVQSQNFYLVNKDILGISFDLFISTKCNITEKWFIGKRNTSIFKIINKFWKEKELFIGTESEIGISEKDFARILKALPNNNELGKYVEARICGEFKNYLLITDDYVSQFQKYLNSKQSDTKDFVEIDFSDFDLTRYKTIYKKLKEMLVNDKYYNENSWQKIIMSFIQVLFPKYIIIGNQPQIKTISEKNKRPDIIVGDVDGYVDIIEIKKPFATGILSAKKSQLYRDNYIPLRELSGAIMQCEKYIFYMTSDVKNIQNDLNIQYKSIIPNDYSFQIVNPKAMIIMGRSNNFNNQQKKDFEIIKRKYKNIIDIITYDDLLYRFEQTIRILENKNKGYY